MSKIKFGYNEAIGHGWVMTKKYIKLLFIFAAVYLAMNVVSGVLEHFAGSNKIQRYETNEIFKDHNQAGQFYLYLQDAGYINSMGYVQDKLQQITTPDDLSLPPAFESKRNDIFEYLKQYQYRLPFPKFVFYGLTVFLWIFNLFISIGFIKACIHMSRDEEPSLSELFSNWNIFIPYLLGSICYGLMIMIGFILLIIPGIIFILMFQLYSYLIIDKGLGPIEALKRSREITKGSRVRLAVFGLLLILLNIGGLLCLVIGLFFTLSISSIAMAYVYDRLENGQTL